jgi:hypothetical protein
VVEQRYRFALEGPKMTAALTLLLAACEQATHELKKTDVELDGLVVDLESLSSRLHDLLGQDPRKTSTAQRQH